MILQAHARDHRHVLVTNDSKAFVKHGRREKLETLCGTRIRTRAEFLELARADKLDSLRGRVSQR